MATKGKFGQPALPWNPLPYMDEYMLELEVEEREDNYIRMVRVGLARFADFAASEGIKHPGEITRETILRYQAHLLSAKKDDGQPLAKSYRERLMGYVRAWINWLAELNYIQGTPWVGIKVGSTAKKSKTLEEDEVLALFQTHKQQAFSISPFAFHRREVILAILYGWGLRIHELQSLNVTQMDNRLEFVAVRNKGGGTKHLPYNDELKTIVQRWLVIRARSATHGEDALIIDQQGGRLSIGMIRKIITELGDRAGVKVNPHRFRDTFGTTMLDNDVPIERIMKMMGHTKREQTLAYARVNDHKVKESHDAVMAPKLKELLA